MAADTTLLDAIRTHYDRHSPRYQRWWGEHIHHGYWEKDETPEEAQRQLTERLARLADVPHGAHVLDVGCGLGGSSLWLARERGCFVTGITISPVQVRLASRRAQREGLQDRVHFRVLDANQLELPSESFDVVWVIECSEHLTDKARFVASCVRVLTHGGKLALCAWLAAEHYDRPEQAQLVAEVCRGMLCPALARLSDYTGWMKLHGLDVCAAEDITDRVARTWKHCEALTKRPLGRAVLYFLDRQAHEFVRTFATMSRAYAERAMGYGMFVAQKS